MSLQAKDFAVGDRVVNKTFPPISRHTHWLSTAVRPVITIRSTSIWILPRKRDSTTSSPTGCW
jgi:hypothetical protein